MGDTYEGVPLDAGAVFWVRVEATDPLMTPTEVKHFQKIGNAIMKRKPGGSDAERTSGGEA